MRNRNRYLDLLRAAAIGRVIVYHLFGWPWLTIVLPAMGVMFALAWLGIWMAQLTPIQALLPDQVTYVLGKCHDPADAPGAGTGPLPWRSRTSTRSPGRTPADANRAASVA